MLSEAFVFVFPSYLPQLPFNVPQRSQAKKAATSSVRHRSHPAVQQYVAGLKGCAATQPGPGSYHYHARTWNIIELDPLPLPLPLPLSLPQSLSLCVIRRIALDFASLFVT
ncbi:hypothetical protein ACLKA7_002948 [Drosophila subpalustris]